MHEDHGPLLPTSTYGASKLAGEALISSLLRDVRPHRPRVPVRQRRRPAPDARRRLRLRPPAARRPDPARDPRRRRSRASRTSTSPTSSRAVLLGDTSASRSTYQVYNVATGDYITVTEIAELAVDVRRARSRPTSSSSTRAATAGWKGDVPIVRLDTAPHPGARLVERDDGPRGARALDALDARGRPRRTALEPVMSRTAPCSSTATACSSGRSCATGSRGHRRRSTSWRSSPASPTRVPELRAAGFLLICVTNQPDIARGTATASRGRRSSTTGCARAARPRRRADAARTTTPTTAPAASPGPGLLLEAAARCDVDLAALGDGRRPLARHRSRRSAPGCRTVFVDHGYAERRPEDPDLVVRRASRLRYPGS